MPTITLYIAVSVDGYIADADGGVGWLPSGDGGDDYGYAAFYAGVDAIVMGRRTYEQVRGFGVPWPYPGKPAYVFTNRPPGDGGSDGDGGGHPPEVEFIRSDAGAFVRNIAVRYASIVWLVGGADLAEQFRIAGLIDEYRVFIIPVILGGAFRCSPGMAALPIRRCGWWRRKSLRTAWRCCATARSGNRRERNKPDGAPARR